MLHITVEIIENFEGVQIKGKRHFGNGSSDLSMFVTKKALDAIETPEAEIDGKVLEIIHDLRNPK